MSLERLNQLRKAFSSAANRLFALESSYRAVVLKEIQEPPQVCDKVPEAIRDIILDHGMEAMVFNLMEEGEEHAFVVARGDDGEAIRVELPFCVYEEQRAWYEIGEGLWDPPYKMVTPEDIMIEPIGLSFSYFTDNPPTVSAHPFYQQFKESLERPPATVLPQYKYERRFAPCDPPEDPNLPTPTTEEELEATFGFLSHNQRIIAATIAAELVLPIYQEGYPADKSVPEIIDVVKRWMNGEAREATLRSAMSLAGSAVIEVTERANLHYSNDLEHAQANAAVAIYNLAAEALSTKNTYSFDVQAVHTVILNAALAYSQYSDDPPQDFLALWWKEVRCRLAFADVTEAELTTGCPPTGTVAQPPYYAPLKEYLEEPSPTILPQRGYERYLTPCDPPDDPEWPAPLNHSDIRELLVRLAHKQQVICALTAAEMVLPIFERGNPNNDRPRVAINTAYRWIEGQASREEVRDAANATARTALDSTAGAAAYDAAYAASYDPIDAAASATHAASSAVDAASVAAVVFWGITRVEFYELWWRECRCRLPFTDPSSTELTTGQLPLKKSDKRVAIGVIEKDGKFLVSKRKAPSSNPGYWEFGGGKVDPGETSEEAVVREFKEEYGIDVKIQEQLGSIEKPELDMGLDIFLLEIKGRKRPKPIVSEEIRWVELEDAAAFDKLLPGMLEIIELVRRHLKIPKRLPSKDPFRNLSENYLFVSTKKNPDITVAEAIEKKLKLGSGFTGQLLGCGAHGCAIELEDGSVLKITIDKKEVADTRILIKHGLHKHPGTAKLHSERIFCVENTNGDKVCAYRTEKLIPLTELERPYSKLSKEVGQLEYLLDGIACFYVDAPGLATKAQLKQMMANSIGELKGLKKHPALGKIADLNLALIRKGYVMDDMHPLNVGYRVNKDGSPNIKGGLVRFDTWLQIVEKE